VEGPVPVNPARIVAGTRADNRVRRERPVELHHDHAEVDRARLRQRLEARLVIRPSRRRPGEPGLRPSGRKPRQRGSNLGGGRVNRQVRLIDPAELLGVRMDVD
jgi:hypothetical protein